MDLMREFLQKSRAAVHDYFYGCTMLDGSTLDLTSRTNAWPVTSAFTAGKKTVTFVENANITVKLVGTRTTSPSCHPEKKFRFRCTPTSFLL